MTVSIITEGLLGGGAGNPAAPVVTFVSPTPSTPPGAPGGFSADFSTATRTPIVIQVTDADGSSTIKYLHVMAVFLDGSVESVFHGTNFDGRYVLGSSQHSVVNGSQMSIGRDGGWPGATAAGNLAVGLMVDVVDAGGNVTSVVAYYQLPPQGPVASLNPPTPEPVLPAAVDMASEAISLVVSQFRSNR